MAHSYGRPFAPPNPSVASSSGGGSHNLFAGSRVGLLYQAAAISSEMGVDSNDDRDGNEAQWESTDQGVMHSIEPGVAITQAGPEATVPPRRVNNYFRRCLITEALQQQKEGSGHGIWDDLDSIPNTLEELEVEADPFAIPSTVRSDNMSIFIRIVETIVILLAVQQSTNMSRTTEAMFVAPLLCLLVYFSSMVKYVITHLNRKITLVRRRMNRFEKEGLIQRHKLLREQRQRQTRPIMKPASETPTYTLIRSELVEEHPQIPDQDLVVAEYELPPQQQHQFPSHAVFTLAQTRLATSEMAFGFINNVMYLVNAFVTFLLVRIFYDAVNASFSDGLWIIGKLSILITLIFPVFVEFLVAGYKQDSVSRSYRFGG